LKIFNARLGHATNSSSTHSTVFIDQPVGDNGIDGRFGWGYFTAASPGAKMHYFALQLYYNFRQTIGEDAARSLARALVANLLPDQKPFDIPLGDDDYIDHQSVWSLPGNPDNVGRNIAFARELGQFFLRDDVVILGGNDNEDEASHPLSNIAEHTEEYWDSGSHVVARKDQQGFWTLFNRHTGAKTRFSFEREAKAPTHSMGPELIDIKITDFCTKGCAYCYQNSNSAGKHADSGYLSSLFWRLEDVLEFAIGGGEPTAHPDFFELLKRSSWRGITPSFSTREVGWLWVPKLAQTVMEYGGSYALSMEDTGKKFAGNLQLEDIVEQVAANKYKKPVLHIPVGAQSEWQLRQSLRDAMLYQLPVVLLGFKSVGRGANFKPQMYDWVTAVKEETKGKWLDLRIDTTLASKYKQELGNAGVNLKLLEFQEGRFSCYIDAVNKTFGPSSFCGPEKMRPLEGHIEGTLRAAMEEWAQEEE